MSTKNSYMWGEGYHFYFDYKDMDYHLEFGNKEIDIPAEFKKDLAALCGVRMSLENIFRELRKIEEKERKRFAENVRMVDANKNANKAKKRVKQ